MQHVPGRHRVMDAGVSHALDSREEEVHALGGVEVLPKHLKETCQ